jgi:hypothetical protein
MLPRQMGFCDAFGGGLRGRRNKSGFRSCSGNFSIRHILLPLCWCLGILLWRVLLLPVSSQIIRVTYTRSLLCDSLKRCQVGFCYAL